MSNAFPRFRTRFNTFLRGGNRSQTWEGIYRSFTDVPAEGAGFESAEWLKESVANFHALRAATERGTIEPTLTSLWLSTTAAMVQNHHLDVCVLDAGGNLGSDFLPLTRFLPQATALRYHILESRTLCEKGRELFKEDGRVHFHEHPPTDLPSVDILHINSSLQYIEDYQDFLAQLVAYKPSYVLLNRLSATAGPTFATAQHRYGRPAFAYWFINLQEVKEALAAEGLSLLMQAPAQHLPLSPELQKEIIYTSSWTLLFGRPTEHSRG